MTGTTAGGKKLWNYQEAFEPVSRGERPARDMISPSAAHRYLLVILAVALVIALLVILKGQKDPGYEESAIALMLGYVVGQLWRWEPPR